MRLHWPALRTLSMLPSVPLEMAGKSRCILSSSSSYTPSVIARNDTERLWNTSARDGSAFGYAPRRYTGNSRLGCLTIFHRTSWNV